MLTAMFLIVAIAAVVLWILFKYPLSPTGVKISVIVSLIVVGLLWAAMAAGVGSHLLHA